MADQKEATRNKKPYVKPEIAKVPLRPEEAVLGACQMVSGTGPFGTCGTSCPTTTS